MSTVSAAFLARAGSSVGRQQPPLHRPVLAQSPGQRPGVDAGDAGDALGLEPGAQRAGRGVVAVLAHVGLHHQPLHLDAAGLVGTVQGTGRARRGNAVAADQRVGEDEDLAAVRRVGERLDVAGHPGVEDHLAADRPRRPERTAGHLRAVLQQELHRYGSVHARTSDRAKQLRPPDDSLSAKSECGEKPGVAMTSIGFPEVRINEQKNKIFKWLFFAAAISLRPAILRQHRQHRLRKLMRVFQSRRTMFLDPSHVRSR